MGGFKGKHAVWLLGIGAAAVVFVACIEKSVPVPGVCDTNEHCDTSREMCDVVTHKCVPKGMILPDLAPYPDGFLPDLTYLPDLTPMCTPMTQLTKCPLATPLCGMDGNCTKCTDDTPCTDRTATPWCRRSMGDCVECIEAKNCATKGQACDVAMAKCVPCKDHGDCYTGICDRVFGGMGKCLLESEIVYVKADMCTGTTHKGDIADPYCKISDALANLAMKKYIKVAPSTTAYGAIIFTAKTTLTIVGTPAHPWVTGPKVKVIGGGDAGISVTGGSGANLSVDGIEVTGSTGGVVCTSGVSQLTLRRSYIHDNTNGDKPGVAIDDCIVTLDSNQIGPNNTGGGVNLQKARYTLINNLIVKNQGSVGPGVQFDNDMKTAGTFIFNTVADNTHMGLQGGIVCNGPDKNLDASIVVGNSMKSGSQFLGNCVLRSVIVGAADTASIGMGGTLGVPLFRMPGTDYRIDKAGSTACCVDKVNTGMDGGAPMYPSYDIEGDPRPSPMGSKFDIGADEVP